MFNFSNDAESQKSKGKLNNQNYFLVLTPRLNQNNLISNSTMENQNKM